MRSRNVAGVAALLAALVFAASLAVPMSAHATEGSSRSSEGVECPAAVGPFTIAPEISRSADDPVNRSLECWYRNADGVEIALLAYWTLYRDPDTVMFLYCDGTEPGKHVKSATRSAYVGYDNAGREPAAAARVAQELLTRIEPHAITCDPNASTTTMTTSPPPSTATTRHTRTIRRMSPTARPSPGRSARSTGCSPTAVG